MGRQKATLKLDGTPLLDRAVDRIRPIATAVMLASGATPMQRDGCVAVTDATGDRGPLGGIVAALEASPEARCAVVAVDMPDLDAELLGALAVRCHRVDAVVPLSERGFEPLHAVYSRSALRTLQDALDSGDLSAHRALMRLRVRYVNAVALGAATEFARNLNTPDDVRRWLADRRAAAPPQD